MNSLLTAISLLLAVAIVAISPTSGPTAVITCAVCAAMAVFLLNRVEDHKLFLIRIFIAGLLVRMMLGALIFHFDLQRFFGGDANTYDEQGFWLVQSWFGRSSYANALELRASGWGMSYIVASIYTLTGRNPLAVQFVNAVVGAATAPLIFLCAEQLFQNIKVARMAALLVAFFPSLVLWSSQGLKDGPIIFLLALTMLATLRLREKFSAGYFIALLLAISGIFALRFYIFYMLLAAVGGGFLIGAGAQTRSLVRQFVIIIVIGLALTYLGVLRTASQQLETFGNLEAVQRSRRDMANRAESGFASELDVSTTSGAIGAVPVGMTYLLLAPFPWQVTNLRQSITLPEMLMWWAAIPLLVVGLWFTLKHRLRQASPILLFTFMLTLAYSIFQGNVGTAYRQRAQLLIFYFIFVAVGFVLLKERREAKLRSGVRGPINNYANQ